MSDSKLLGTTDVSAHWRMSLIKDVREEFEAMGEDVAIGDKMVFWRRGDDIVIETQ